MLASSEAATGSTYCGTASVASVARKLPRDEIVAARDCAERKQRHHSAGRYHTPASPRNVVCGRIAAAFTVTSARHSRLVRTPPRAVSKDSRDLGFCLARGASKLASVPRNLLRC